MSRASHPGLEALLDLDGEMVVLDGGWWVKFVVHRVPPDQRRPHGIGYSLTLHGRNGERIFGIDNAYPIRDRKSGNPTYAADHMHRGSVVKPYTYVDAQTLMVDFWAGVEAAMERR